MRSTEKMVRRGITLCKLRDTVSKSSCSVSEDSPKVGSVVRMRCADTDTTFDGSPGGNLSFHGGEVFVIKSISPEVQVGMQTNVRIFAAPESFPWLWMPCDAMEVLEVSKSTANKVSSS